MQVLGIIATVIAVLVLILFLALLIRSIPDLVRYARVRRM